MNYQTTDVPLQVYLGKFRDNGGCGYVLKPNDLIVQDHFNPDETEAVAIGAMQLSITIISGQQLAVCPTNPDFVRERVCCPSFGMPSSPLTD